MGLGQREQGLRKKVVENVEESVKLKVVIRKRKRQDGGPQGEEVMSISREKKS